MNWTRFIVILVVVFVVGIMGWAIYSTINQSNFYQTECPKFNLTVSKGGLECVNITQDKIIAYYTFVKLNDKYYLEEIK